MEDKYKKLIERIKNNDLYTDDLISKSSDYVDTAHQVEDLAGKTLGSEYLRQTGVSIPDIKTASRSQVESFLNKLKEEAYPELNKTSIELKDSLKNIDKDAKALFYPDFDKIQLSKDRISDVNDLAGTTFHELGHSYDKTKGLPKSVPVETLTSDKKQLLKSLGLKSGKDLTKLDSSDISEIVQLGHHANLPKLREGTFGLGALKGLVNNKAFKSALPFIGPAIAGGATMLATGDASAALQEATPILGEAGNLGPEQGSLEEQVENPQVSPEQRRKAIETLMKMNNQ